MRLLPRSRCGTWLLAGAVWLAACAGWWLFTPLKQHTVILPEFSRFVGLAPSLGVGLVERNTYDARRSKPHGWALEIVDLSDGRSVAELFPQIDRQDLLGVSDDGRTWLFSITVDGVAKMVKLDPVSRAAIELKMPPPEEGGSWATSLSRDGRWSTLCHTPDLKVTRIEGGFHMEWKSTSNLVIWDVVNDRLCGEIKNCDPPYAFSANSRFVVGSGDNSTIAIVDTESAKTTATIPWGAGLASFRLVDLALSDDGKYVAVQYHDWADGNDGRIVVKCWSVVDKSMIVHDKLEMPAGGPTGLQHTCKLRFVGGGRLLALLPNFDDGIYFRCYDMLTGQSVSERFPNKPLIWDSSPDGRRLIALRATTADDFFHALAWRLGLQWDQSVEFEVMVFDPLTGQQLGGNRFVGGPLLQNYEPEWSSDGKTLISKDQPGRIATLWDIPPRKSLMWFAAGAILIALPIAFLARRRVRKLRAA